MRQVAGISQAGENVLVLQSGVVCKDFGLGLSGREQFEDKLNGQTGSSDHWLTGHNLRIDDDAFGKRHNPSLPCVSAVRDCDSILELQFAAWICRLAHHRFKSPLNEWEIEGRFAAKLLPAHESANGFFYFQTSHRPGSKFYLTGIKKAATGEDILYFEVSLDRKP